MARLRPGRKRLLPKRNTAAQAIQLFLIRNTEFAKLPAEGKGCDLDFLRIHVSGAL
jgi:hypothetical protein